MRRLFGAKAHFLHPSAIFPAFDAPDGFRNYAKTIEATV
jgi:hypothetical protein